MVSIDDELVFPDNRAGAISVHTCEHTRMYFPDVVTIEVIRCYKHFIYIEKTYKYLLTICYRR